MVQVINDPNRNQGYSPYIRGISSALEGLIHQKTNELAQRKQRSETASGLQQLFNIPTQEAHHMAQLEPNVLDKVLRDRFQKQQETQVQEKRAGGLESLFGFSPEEAQNIAPLLDNPKALKSLLSPEQLQLKPSFGKPVMGTARKKKEIIQEKPTANLLKQLSSQQQQAAPITGTPEVAEVLPPQPPVVEPIKPLGAKEKSAAMKEEKKAVHEQKKLSDKEQAEAQKETKKYYDKVLEVEKSAQEADNRLNRMSKLIEKGDLPFSTYYNLLKNLEEHISPSTGAAAGAAVGTALGGFAGGIPSLGLGAVPGSVAGGATGAAIGGAVGGLINPVVGVLRSVQKLISPDTEEFEKLSNQFIGGAKAIFGARVTDNDLKAFMAQIPTLSNTDAGKKKIIHSMKIANEAEHIRADTMKEIIKENGGKRPFDLPLQVEERAKPEIDRLAEKFAEGIQPGISKKPVATINPTGYGFKNPLLARKV